MLLGARLSGPIRILVIAIAMLVATTTFGHAPAGRAATSGISWTQTDDVPVDVGSASVVVAQGHLFSIGGTTGATPISAVYRGAIAGGGAVTWSAGSVNTLPYTIASASAASDGTHVYLAGGSNPIRSDVLVSTVSAGGAMTAWTSTGSLPQPRVNSVAEIVGDYIYVMGGQDASGFHSEVYYNKILAGGALQHDPWLTTNPLPDARYQHASTVIGNHIYVSGGNNAAAAGYSTVWRGDVNLATGAVTWSSVQSLPLNRVQHGMASLGTRLFVIAGNVSTNPTQQNTVYSIDTDGSGNTIGTWDLETNAYGEAIHLVNDPVATHNGRIYVVGGDYDSPNGESNQTYFSSQLGPPPPPDADGDGVPDPDDDCPNDAEDLDGFADGDGCPERGSPRPRIQGCHTINALFNGVLFALDVVVIIGGAPATGGGSLVLVTSLPFIFSIQLIPCEPEPLPEGVIQDCAQSYDAIGHLLSWVSGRKTCEISTSI